MCLTRQDEEVVLQNPADVLLYVQVLPLALLPNPSVFSGKLADRWEEPPPLPLFFPPAPLDFSVFDCNRLCSRLRLPLGNLSNINIDTNTLEFQVHRNRVSVCRVVTVAHSSSVSLLVFNSLLSICVCLSGGVCVCQTSLTKSSSGFVEGSTRPFVYNLLLQPGEVKSFSVRFTPVSNHSVSSLLIVR